MSSVPSTASTRVPSSEVFCVCVSVPVTRVVPEPAIVPPDQVPEPIVSSPAPVIVPADWSSRATLDALASVSDPPASFNVPGACTEPTSAVAESVTSLPAGIRTTSPAAGTRPRSQLAAVAHAPLAPV
jgi:hypothetical protein